MRILVSIVIPNAPLALNSSSDTLCLVWEMVCQEILFSDDRLLSFQLQIFSLYYVSEKIRVSGIMSSSTLAKRGRNCETFSVVLMKPLCKIVCMLESWVCGLVIFILSRHCFEPCMYFFLSTRGMRFFLSPSTDVMGFHSCTMTNSVFHPSFHILSLLFYGGDRGEMSR